MAVVLPAWTNRQPDWQAEVQPTLCLQGGFKVLDGVAYRGITADNVQSHFSYSNLVWRIPDLTATRREGSIQAFHEADERTKSFYWRLHSAVDRKPPALCSIPTGWPSWICSHSPSRQCWRLKSAAAGRNPRA